MHHSTTSTFLASSEVQFQLVVYQKHQFPGSLVHWCWRFTADLMNTTDRTLRRPWLKEKCAIRGGSRMDSAMIVNGSDTTKGELRIETRQAPHQRRREGDWTSILCSILCWMRINKRRRQCRERWSLRYLPIPVLHVCPALRSDLFPNKFACYLVPSSRRIGSSSTFTIGAAPTTARQTSPLTALLFWECECDVVDRQRSSSHQAGRLWFRIEGTRWVIVDSASIGYLFGDAFNVVVSAYRKHVSLPVVENWDPPMLP